MWVSSSEGFFLEQNGTISINYTRFSDNTYVGSILFQVGANSGTVGSTNTISRADVAPDSNTRYLNWGASVNIFGDLTLNNTFVPQSCRIQF